MTHLGHFNRQKTSDLWQGICAKSDMIHLGHLQIKVSELWDSKLLERTVVIVFKVPFPYNYHFSNFLRSVESRPWRATTLLH